MSGLVAAPLTSVTLCGGRHSRDAPTSARPRLGESRRTMPDTSSGRPLKILFVSHSAGRTGAPMVLLHLAHWLRQNTDARFGFIFRGGGNLLSDFRGLAPTVVLPARGFPVNLFGRRI